MMNTNYLSEHFDSDDIDSIRKFIASPPDNFVECSEYFGLDRKVDFRHSDLSGCDFSNSDLRGFDFTGSDLRGSYGTSVQSDSTTILSDADTASSLFAHLEHRRRWLEHDPTAQSELQSLAKRDWFGQWSWIEPNLSVNKANDTPKTVERKRLLALELYRIAKNLTVRIDLIYAMEGILSNNSWNEFLLYQLSADEVEEPFITATCRIFASRYNISDQLGRVLFNLLPRFSFATQLELYTTIKSRAPRSTTRYLRRQLRADKYTQFRRMAMAQVLSACHNEAPRLLAYNHCSNFDPLIGITEHEIVQAQWAAAKLKFLNFLESDRERIAFVDRVISSCERYVGRKLLSNSVGQDLPPSTQSTLDHQKFLEHLSQRQRRSYLVLQDLWSLT